MVTPTAPLTGSAPAVSGRGPAPRGRHSFGELLVDFVRFLHGEERRAVFTAEEGRRVLAFALVLLHSARESRPLLAARSDLRQTTAGPPEEGAP